MTTDQANALYNKQRPYLHLDPLQIKVAELCKFRDIHTERGVVIGYMGENKWHEEVPSYTFDLNAMWNIEQDILKGKIHWGDNPHNTLEWADYYKALMEVTGTTASYFAGHKMINATAKQKAIAFVVAMTSYE